MVLYIRASLAESFEVDPMAMKSTPIEDGLQRVHFNLFCFRIRPSAASL